MRINYNITVRYIDIRSVLSQLSRRTGSLGLFANLFKWAAGKFPHKWRKKNEQVERKNTVHDFNERHSTK